ncbi:hypothetical protein ACET3Z_022231 [Daucus carota]
MKFLFFLLQLLLVQFVHSQVNFTYNGFKHADLSCDGDAYLRSDGIMAITNDKPKLIGHAYYPSALQFMPNQNKGNKSSVVTFSTNFVFSINPKYPEIGGHGLTFVLLSTKQPQECRLNQYLGLPNDTSMETYSTRALAVEFDVVQNLEFMDINDNHVGIDISSLISNISKPAAYFIGNTTMSINLKSGSPFHAWIDYNNQEMLLNVTVAPLGVLKPQKPLITFPIDLSTVINEYMYIGFTASTGLLSASHNILGWSFCFGGKAQDLDPSDLPTLDKSVKVIHSKGFIVGISLATVTLVILIILGATHIIHHFRNEDDIMEDWEVEYGARRFKYSDLVAATRGFGEKHLIGSGGFGRVYKGVIPDTGLEVAIKRIAQDSRQGMREFVAEITSMGRLRHRNLTTHIVGTLGYLAPELTKTGKATTRTDVYGYGALMLELVSGRRPIEPQKNPEELVLVDWVRDLHSQGKILHAVDPTLDEYNQYEAEVVLSLGLLCSHPLADHRPSMRCVVQVLLGDASIPQLPFDIHQEGAGVITDYSMIYDKSCNPPSDGASSSQSTSFTGFDKKLVGTQVSRATF